MDLTDPDQDPGLVLCDYAVPSVHAMKTYGTVAVMFHASLAWAIYGVSWSA